MIDYEKAYNEALERAKAWKPLDDAFPELKESEDERIRKHIIKILDNLAPCHWDGNEKAKCIAYLEKQKEQKPAEWSDNFEENIRELLHDKLTWHSEDGSMSSAVSIDDKTLKDIISGIWFYVGKEALKYPNKELSQPEWSEEDELMRDTVLNTLERIGDYGTIGMQKDWIKSLRHRPHWKPSEEYPEVDLEKETKRWWKEHLHLHPENQLWMNAHQSVVFARHFYELGLNARKEETK